MLVTFDPTCDPTSVKMPPALAAAADVLLFHVVPSMVALNFPLPFCTGFVVPPPPHPLVSIDAASRRDRIGGHFN